MSENTGNKVSIFKLFGYALGEGSVSITMNGIANFAMLYYTQVLGLGAKYAGLALGVTTIWDAITDPVMGHITDNTRSRFGRRHQYVLAGGIFLALSFYLLWYVPPMVKGPVIIFWTVLVINLLVRTASTVLIVPYTALGFEICPEYVDRSRLQGIRYFLNQIVNLVFGAFAWTIFFKDRTGADGQRIDGTTIMDNYLNMGTVLALASFVLILICVFATRQYAVDNRDAQTSGNGVKDFFEDIAGIFKDKLAWFVFGFFVFAQLGMLLVSQVQMFTYVVFMQFTAGEKTFVHGGGMVAFALGALSLSWLVKRFDKKKAGYVGLSMGIIGGLALFFLFTTGFMPPKATIVVAGTTVPIATGLFALFQGFWWGGAGIVVPLATSMIADLSEVNKVRTGLLKDGSYSAVFSFALKMCSSLGLFVTGWLVDFAGIVSGAPTQTPEAASSIATMTFLSGPILVIPAIYILHKYPIDRHFMQQLREKHSVEGLL